jgi:hypothetical protein
VPKLGEEAIGTYFFQNATIEGRNDEKRVEKRLWILWAFQFRWRTGHPLGGK